MRALAVVFVLVGCTTGVDSVADAPEPDAPSGGPVAMGCITDVTTGDHVYTCGGLTVDVRDGERWTVRERPRPLHPR